MKHSQLTTLDHVSHQQHEAMVAKGEENAGLIKYTPHFCCNFIDYVVPATSTRIDIWIILKLLTDIF